MCKAGLKTVNPKELPDGIIKPGDNMPWGFTPDRWRGASYLWRDGNTIILSMLWVHEMKRGYLTDLLDGIERDGFDVDVPTPFPVVRRMLEKRGYKMRLANTEIGNVFVCGSVRKEPRQ